MGRPRNTLADFINRVDIQSNTSCWNWKAYIDKEGYGLFSYEGQTLKAHRLSWIIINGKIPSKLVILHTCHNKTCVNPRHLKLGTQSENMQDTDRKHNKQYRGILLGIDRYTRA